jgi:hydroxypyruvate reductase
MSTNHYFRNHLLTIYQAALHAVNGRQAIADYLRHHSLPTPLAVIAIGKAAPAMTLGAFDILSTQITSALLITKKGHLDKSWFFDYPMTCLEAAHPIPDASSLAAGNALLNFINQLPPRYPLLCLISGGTSALVEVLAPGIKLSDLQRINQWLLATGLDIHAINAIRKKLSTIKGGRLAGYLSQHPIINLLISDVPGDDLSNIGSGLLTWHETIELPKNLPQWIAELLTQAAPFAQASDFQQIKQVIIANAAAARQAASRQAKQLGYWVHQQNEFIVGEAQIAGQRLAHYLSIAQAGIHIWSSETTVQLPKNPGNGGRCQSLALAMAEQIKGQKNLWFLAAGTDGNDGPGKMAGALVDGMTIKRGQQRGFNAQDCLRQADAGRFLAASGDLIETGPTGTNVMDILIGLKMEVSQT